MSEADRNRYLRAHHAMQSGVAFEIGRHKMGLPGFDAHSAKYLRTGVNAAMVDHTALVLLLISKGIITEDEYEKALADSMEAEVASYEARATKALGSKTKVTFG